MMIPLNQYHWVFQSCHISNQQANREVPILIGVTEPDHQENWFAQFPLHNGAKEEYGWNIGDPLTHFLVSPCPVIKVVDKKNNLIQVGLLMASTF